MGNKKFAEAVARRFIQAMKIIIAEERSGVTTQKEFSDRVGEYSQNISRIKDGNRYPTIDMLCIMCDEFGIAPGWLLLGAGEMNASSEVTIGHMFKRLADIEKMVNKQRLTTKRKTG